MAHNVADVIVETLRQAGAMRCYGVAGDTLNFFTDSWRRSGGRWIHVRHEEAGAMAAGADALLSDRLTLCAGSTGPGSLHFINGLYEAHRNRAPVVLIASQITRDELGFDFPQEVDFKRVYQAGTVFCEEIRTPDQAARLTAMAAQAALSKRGVAVLIMPVDVSKAHVDKVVPYPVHRARPVVRPSDFEIVQLAEIINSGKKITIYGGSGCENAHREVIQLAESLKAPLARTSRAKDFLEHDNPNDVGMTGIFGTPAGYHAIMNCDVLLLLGCDFAWKQYYPDKAKIVQIDLDGAHLGRRHPVDLAVVGDIASTIKELMPHLQSRQDGSFLAESLKIKAKAVAKLEERAKSGKSGKIHPQYLTEVVCRLADEDAIYTADGGSPMVWGLRHVNSNGSNRFMASLSHGTMANAMPQALGAKVAFPDRQVISLSGDGGLSMLMGDLLTTIQEKLAIKVLVFNNSSLGFVELEQKVEGLLDSYTNLVNPDFGKVAEAIGMWGRKVEKAEDLEAAVREWLAHPGPALLDVVIDRFELVLPAKIEAGMIFGTALYSAKGILDGRGEAVLDLITDPLKL